MHDTVERQPTADEVASATELANVRPGTQSDAVLGVVPGVVVSVKSAEEISRLLAWADGRGLKVVPTGTRSKLDRGTPPTACDILLDLSGISGIVEHAAGDMTVTVRAGTPINVLQRELAQAGQFLAIDSPVHGTIGGLIACGDSGALRMRYGGVRDLILGVTFVRADGVIAKGGGKVVKNVAGYDLPKLITGSLGTLGVIVEATFRLYPVPEASATVVAEGITPEQARKAAAVVLSSQLIPAAIDYFAPQNDASSLAVRFLSSPAAVKMQAGNAAILIRNAFDGRQACKMVSGAREAQLWLSYDSITSTAEYDVLAQLVSIPTEITPLLESARQRAQQDKLRLTMRGHMGHGNALLRWQSPAPDKLAEHIKQLRREAQSHSSALAIWRAPAAVRSLVDVWGEMGEGLELMRRIKTQFDPHNTLNPGRFVGGI